MDKISVIVPVYNVEQYLSQCVESILSQTHENLEIFLVDDGSTDRSGAICDEYSKKDPRVVVIHQENCGASVARNVALDRCTGDYVAFADSDDYLYPQAYAQMLAVCTASGAPVGWMQYDLLDGAGQLTQPHHTVYEPLSHQASLSMLLVCCYGSSVCDKLIQREFLSHLRFVPNNGNEDFLFLFQLFLNPDSRVVSTPYVGYCYRFHVGSLTKCPYGICEIDTLGNALEAQAQLASQYPDLAQDAITRVLYGVARVLTTMPQSEIGSTSYTLAIATLHSHRPSIIRAKLSVKFRVFLLLCSLSYPLARTLYQGYKQLTKVRRRRFLLDAKDSP